MEVVITILNMFITRMPVQETIQVMLSTNHHLISHASVLSVELGVLLNISSEPANIAMSKATFSHFVLERPSCRFHVSVDFKVQIVTCVHTQHAEVMLVKFFVHLFDAC